MIELSGRGAWHGGVEKTVGYMTRVDSPPPSNSDFRTPPGVIGDTKTFFDSELLLHRLGATECELIGINEHWKHLLS